MKLLSFIFGAEKRESRSGVSARIVDGAHGQLKSKIIRNPVNKWWAVLLREYLIWPLLRLPIIPLSATVRNFATFKLLSYVLGVLSINGAPTYRNLPQAVLSVLRKKKTASHVIKAIFQIIIWKPNVLGGFQKRPARYTYGSYLWWEKYLTLKFMFLAISTWIFSIAMLIGASFYLANEGLSLFIRDLNYLRTSFDIAGSMRLSQSGATPSIIYSVLLWIMSFILSFIVSERPWNSHTEQALKFLKQFGSLTESDYTRLRIFSFDDIIYISFPNLNIGKIRQLKSGWPRGFLLGEIVENIKNQDDLLVFRRPEMEGIIFGGDKANSEIIDHLNLFDSGIVEPMKKEIKRKSDSEIFFAGEVIDNKWWAGNHVKLDLATSPHCAIVGQTRSGKTKTVLSVVYTFARAYPDTIWYFADGKGSPDYDTVAHYLSTYPVGKPDTRNGDNLIQFANIIETLWTEFLHRRYLFEKATKMEGKSCSTIYQYRELVGPMPQIFFVCDEFAFFVNEMNFTGNWRAENTLAYKIKNLVNQAASMGFHFILASQRYTETDMPPTIRSGMTTLMVHHVQMKDADHTETPEAVHLDKGQFYVRASGLFCHHTGISKVKAKMPYIGDKPDALMAKTLKAVDPSLKKDFDYHLIYSRGGDEVDKMSISQFCIRLYKFFKDQGYITTNLLADLEAGDLQMEAQKAKQFKKKGSANPIELEAIPGAQKFGISVMKADDLDENAIQGIQDKYSMYQAIVIFVTGRNISSDKLKFVSKMNERSPRFIVLPSRDYLKDLRYVEMKRKEGIYIDLIREKLARVGVVVSTDKANLPAVEATKTFSKDVPVVTLLDRLVNLLKLPIIQPGSDLSLPGLDLPYLKTVLPGGTPLYFLIAKDKNDKATAFEVFDVIKKEAGVCVIISTIVAESDKKTTSKKDGLLFWTPGMVFAMIQSLETSTSGKPEDKSNKSSENQIINLMTDLGLLKATNNSLLIGLNRAVTIHPGASLSIRATIANSPLRISTLKISCETTRYNLVNINNIELQYYRRDTLDIPETTQIFLQEGIAPLGTLSDKIVDARTEDEKNKSLIKSKEWHVNSMGILSRAKANISEEDELLLAMQGYDG